jgi:YhcH/YjgK/YiaL family protein
MIIDTLENARFYYGVNKGIEKALKYLENTDFSTLSYGEYEIEGDKIFAKVQENLTQPIEAGKWEAHKKYIDVQFVFKGIEIMGYSNISRMKITEQYDKNIDCMFLEGKGDFFKVHEGSFVVFQPIDIHMPGISNEKPQKVKKVIVKVQVQ